MSLSEAVNLDCKVDVRRYLIKRRSPLGDLSLSPRGRDVVVIPVDSPETSHGIVAMRLLKGPSGLASLERDVGFTLMKDLLDHSSVKYEKLNVTTEPFRQHAHGVAHREGESNNFSYRRGDKFWLFDKHSSKVDDGGLLAPVVNLRTSEYGYINVADICWYPDVQGPAGDLWTVLGCLREIRGGRVGTSICSIYRVNQPISLKKQAFGQVRIEGGIMAKKERNTMYLQKVQAMVEREDQHSTSCPSPATVSVPPTPPPASLPSESLCPRRMADRTKANREDSSQTPWPAPGLPQEQPATFLDPQPTSVRSQSNSFRLPLEPPRPSGYGHDIQVVDSCCTPLDGVDFPYSPKSAYSSSMGGSDQCSLPELDLYDDFGGVRILETPETLADTLHKGSLGILQKPCRPYSSFSEEFLSYSNLTTSDNIVIAKHGFKRTTGGQIDVEIGEAITDVEYMATVDVMKEHFWRGRNSRGYFGEFPSWIAGHIPATAMMTPNVGNVGNTCVGNMENAYVENVGGAYVGDMGNIYVGNMGNTYVG